MPHNYVVLRESPNWLAYNEQQSREFCRRFALPEDTILEFISIWDAAFDVGYRRFRHVLKEISLANFRRVRDSIFLEHADFRAGSSKPDDLVVFVDDDDWLAPDLFVDLRGASTGHD